MLSPSGLVGVPAGGDDAFADLGSGLGRLPLFAFLQGLAARAVGVENFETRARLGAAAIKTLSQLLPAEPGEEAAGARSAPVPPAVDDEGCADWAQQGTCEGDPDMAAKCPSICAAAKEEEAPAPSGQSGSGLLEHSGRRVELVQGGMLEHPLQGLTVVLVSVPWMHPDELLRLLAHLQSQLAPGAVVWSLVELPLDAAATAGGGGLVLLKRARVKTSWSSSAVAWLYVRAPSSPLPPPPPLDVASPVSAVRRRAWAEELQAAVGVELARLRAAAATSSQGAGAEVQAGALLEAHFEPAARALYDTPSGSAARRLLHAFGTAAALPPGADPLQDRCGCAVAADGAPLGLGEAGLLAMLAHGTRLAAAECPGAFPCTAGDLVAEEVAASEHACGEESLGQPAPSEADSTTGAAAANGSSAASSTPGLPPTSSSASATLQAGKCAAFRRLACLRFADGSTLLHAALGRNDLPLASLVLKELGVGAWHCRDASGHTPAHTAATAAHIISEQQASEEVAAATELLAEGPGGAAELGAWVLEHGGGSAPAANRSAAHEGGMAEPAVGAAAVAGELQEAEPIVDSFP